jgi:uncharacterized membrane protein
MKESHDLLGRWMAAGVTLSAACLALGLVLAYVDRTLDVPEGPHPLLDTGLIILMVTPLARVLVALSEEIRKRNWFFASMTFIVLAVLCATLWTAVRAA